MRDAIVGEKEPWRAYAARDEGDVDEEGTDVNCHRTFERLAA
jgi:hypothetical protein